MSISDIDKLAALLPTYPLWVRGLMFASAMTWLLAYGGLVFFAPKAEAPGLTIASFRAYQPQVDKDLFVFDIGVENNSGKSRLISAAELQFYHNELPTSGLSAYQEISAKYRVVKNVVGPNNPAGGPPPQPLIVSRPYDGQSYQVVNVATDQSVEDKKTDRFTIIIEPASAIDKENNRVRLTLRSGDKSSVFLDAPLTRP